LFDQTALQALLTSPVLGFRQLVDTAAYGDWFASGIVTLDDAHAPFNLGCGAASKGIVERRVEVRL